MFVVGLEDVTPLADERLGETSPASGGSPVVTAAPVAHLRFLEDARFGEPIERGDNRLAGAKVVGEFRQPLARRRRVDPLDAVGLESEHDVPNGEVWR